MKRLLFLLSACLIVTAGCANAQTCSAPFHAGFTVISFSGVKTGIWYPTTDAEASYAYSSSLSSTLAFRGSVAACGPFPLVLFSHAFGGCGTQSVFITEQLARSGYIVAAPDHKDALCSVDGTGSPFDPGNEPSFLDPASWTDATYQYREQEIETVLNGMLADPVFGSRVDPNRIAGAGHSLGGYTIAAMVGGWSSWTDSRIRAALLFSPYILPFTLNNLLGNINLGLMYQGGQLDIGITPFIQGAGGAYAMSNAPKFFVNLPGATHFEWTNVICANPSTVAACIQSNPNAQLINSYSLAFLNRYLSNAIQPLLLGTGQGLASYNRATQLFGVSAASYAATSGAAPSSIVAGFGEGLAAQIAAPGSSTLPSTLAGITVTVTDHTGTATAAPIYFVAPGQVNYVVPPNVTPGRATVSVQLQGTEIASGVMQVGTVAPALFSASGTGQGVAAGNVIQVAADGTQTAGLTFDPATLASTPVDVSGSNQVYLSLYGTGLRFGSATATIAGVPVPVQGPVPQSTYTGLDQINVGPLPKSLAGRGSSPIVVRVSGMSANTITVNIR